MEQNYVTVILCILLVMGTSLTAQWGRSSPPAVGIGDPLHFQIVYAVRAQMLRWLASRETVYIA